MMAICGFAVGFDAKAPVRDEANVIMDRRDLAQLLPLLGLQANADWSSPAALAWSWNLVAWPGGPLLLAAPSGPSPGRRRPE